jgi:hypothetical protein
LRTGALSQRLRPLGQTVLQMFMQHNHIRQYKFIALRHMALQKRRQATLQALVGWVPRPGAAGPLRRAWLTATDAPSGQPRQGRARVVWGRPPAALPRAARAAPPACSKARAAGPSDLAAEQRLRPEPPGRKATPHTTARTATVQSLTSSTKTTDSAVFGPFMASRSNANFGVCLGFTNAQRQRGDSNPCGQSPMDF